MEVVFLSRFLECLGAVVAVGGCVVVGFGGYLTESICFPHNFILYFRDANLLPFICLQSKISHLSDLCRSDELQNREVGSVDSLTVHSDQT